jgi:hypothetical protein
MRLKIFCGWNKIVFCELKIQAQRRGLFRVVKLNLMKRLKPLPFVKCVKKQVYMYSSGES